MHCHTSNPDRYPGFGEVLTLDTAFLFLNQTLVRMRATWQKDYDGFCVEVSFTLDQEPAVLQTDTG
jgi:hypothetical protein